jgi:hypothetical protein
LNGLGAVDPVTLGAPIGPQGSAGQAQGEVPGITVGVRNFPLSLMGAPVTNSILAFVDYSTIVSRTYSFGTIQAPDITFFNIGEAGIPTPLLELELERFGTTGINASGALEGQRYLLRNITLSNGASSANDQSFRFFYDSGTDLTIIGNTVASALGLVPGGGTFNCFGGTNNGYTISSAAMAAIGGGTFTVNGARVCWQDSAIDTFVSPGVRVDAVLGQNLFDDVPHLINGPGNRLGIGLATESVPEPSAVFLLAFGLTGIGVNAIRKRYRRERDGEI